MAGELSSAGVKLGYAAETTAGQKPTTGYKNLRGVKSIPDFNPEPSALQTTDLSQTEWHTYIPGLKDPGGTLGFGFNNTNDFHNDWEALMAAYEALGEDTSGATKSMWFVVYIPSLAKSFYFSGKPSPLGMSPIEVDSVLEIDAYITPTGFGGWGEPSEPTDA